MHNANDLYVMVDCGHIVFIHTLMSPFHTPLLPMTVRHNLERACGVCSTNHLGRETPLTDVKDVTKFTLQLI